MAQKYGSAFVNLVEVLSEYKKQTQPFWNTVRLSGLLSQRET